MIESQIRISSALRIPVAELKFKTSRSGGPGGQNVNKLETRVEVIFDLANSPGIPLHVRQRLLDQLSSQVDTSGMIHVVVQESRSQWKNKQLALERLTTLLKKALIIRKKRIASNPTRTSREARLQSKKARSKTKQLRKVYLED